MINKIIEEISKSNSLEILRKVNKIIPEKKFHEYTHILYDLRTILGEKEINYLEIGSYVGSSASLILHHNFKSNIYCVDPLKINDKNRYKGNLNHEQTLKKNLEINNIHNNNIKILKYFSNDKNLHNEIKDLKIDILFIDGCHKYQSVINDFNNYKDKVNNGGFIIFDDYLDYKTCPEVKKAVDFIIENYNLDEYEIIGTLENIQHVISNIPSNYSNEFILYKKNK